MKLLPKSVVNTELASQKKKQIDEGLMIAKKVDALRETHASLEKQHQDFLKKIQIELDAQLKPLIEEIATSKKEIEQLGLRKAELMVPLTKEWNEVNRERKEVERISDELSRERISVRKSQEVLDARLKKEKENVVKINTIRNEISKVLKKAEETETETEKTLESARMVKESTLKECEEIKQVVRERDAEVAVREREVQLQKESNDRDSKFIKEEKIRLLDQRATLERALNRKQRD